MVFRSLIHNFASKIENKNNTAMTGKIILTLLLTAMQLTLSAQPMGVRRVNQDSLRAATLDDYEQMKRQIGVTTTRPRRDGKASDPSLRPNYDELKANPFPFYPDPLTTFDGRRVKNARMWQKVRRPELLDFFDQYVVKSDNRRK